MPGDPTRASTFDIAERMMSRPSRHNRWSRGPLIPLVLVAATLAGCGKRTEQGQADAASAQAAIKTAEINLAYTKVVSPISGCTGRSSVTEGALVTANQTTSLVTVTQLNPIYVDVTQPSSTILRFRRELAAGQIKSAAGNQPVVTLTLEDGTGYEQQGKLQFSEVTVDLGTGSVTLRAVFPH